MKKLFAFILTIIAAFSLVTLSGCGAKEPVYADTYTQSVDEEGNFVHYRELLEGSKEDAEYLDYGKCSNKKGWCNTCHRYYVCTALSYALNSSRTGLICYGGANPDNLAIDSNGEFSVSSFDNGNWLHVEVPAYATYNGETYPVLELSNYAFAFDQILSIKLNEGLKKIGSKAFSDIANIKEIILPQSVEHTSYGGGSNFWGCTNLEYVDLGGMTTIPNYCFYRCKNLKSVKTSSNLKQIGFSSFNACENLEYFIIPSTVTEVNSDAQSNGIANNDVYDPFNAIPINKLIIYCEANTIPKGNYHTGVWNATGHKVYLKGEWEYGADGKPKLI